MAIQSDPSIRLSKVSSSSSGPADEQPAVLLVSEEKLRLIKMRRQEAYKTNMIFVEFRLFL